MGIVAGTRREAAILEFGHPLELLRRFAHPGIGFAELRILFGLAKHRDHLSLPHEGTVVEVQPNDPLGDRRGEGDLLVRPGGADRLDPVGKLHRCRGFHLHQRRLARTAALLRIAAAAGRERSRQKGDEKMPGHALLSSS